MLVTMESSDRQTPGRRRYSEALGRAIKLLRTEQRLERKELADRAGISYSYLAEIENGNKPPSSSVLVVLAEALGLRPAQIHAAADKLSARREGETVLLAAEPPAMPQPAMPKRAMPMAALVQPSAAGMRRDRRRELADLLEGLADEDLGLVLDLVRRIRRG
jgi:transcriptional regulator with XRE-family HTH domain